MLHIRSLGNWTQRLHATASAHAGPLKVLIEGPYGAPALDLHSARYKCVLRCSHTKHDHPSPHDGRFFVNGSFLIVSQAIGGVVGIDDTVREY